MTENLLNRKFQDADRRLKYGKGAVQFGDLRIPVLAVGHRAPIVVFVHGGWWRTLFGLGYGGHLCSDLKKHGIATWSVEYRRVGEGGGGWPGTFQDVAAAYDYLAELGRGYPVDLGRVVVVGHSAGGHLAYWLAGRQHVPAVSPLYQAGPLLPMRGVVALAGAVDLRMTLDLAGSGVFEHDRQEVVAFMGGTPAEVPERYRAGDPGALLPLNVPQVLVQGREDNQIPPELPVRWAERGRRMGERVSVEILSGADHFDVVDPESKVWPQVRAAIVRALA